MSSFVIQADRIKTLEQDILNQNTQIARLKQQLQHAVNDKDRLVKEKAEVEARLKHEMKEKVQEAVERGELKINEVVSQNSELKRDLAELKQAKFNDKTNFQRTIASLEKQIPQLTVENQEHEATIMKLRELVEQREERIGTLMQEIEQMTTKLIQAQEALFDAQNSD